MAETTVDIDTLDEETPSSYTSETSAPTGQGQSITAPGQALGRRKEAIARVRHCERCNTFTDAAVCDTCSSPERDPTVLCVVETPADQLMVEQTLSFNGLYFVLMGRLSPLDGIGPREIHFERLAARACDGVVREVILEP